MLLACCIFAATVSRPLDDYTKSLAWANGQYEQAQFPKGAQPRSNTQEALEDFLTVQKKYGVRAQTSLGIAKCQLKLCEFDKARATLESGPQDDACKKLLARINSDMAFIQKVKDGPNEVLGVDQIGSNWVLLTGERNPQSVGSTPPFDRSYDKLRLRLLQDNGKELWSTAFNDKELDYNESTLNLIDLDGDKKPEVVVFSVFYGASAQPVRFAPYKLIGSRLAPLGQLTCAEGFELTDLRHNGHLVACATRAIGAELAHAEQPRWTDYYVSDGGPYLCVDGNFASRYDSLYPYIQKLLKTHLHDVQLLAYSAEYQAIHGRWSRALELTTKTRRACDITYKIDKTQLTEDKEGPKRIYDLNLKMVKAMQDAYKHKHIAMPMEARGSEDS